jgi:hypothetical protein
MQKLINQFANQGEMISRSLSELYDNVRDFHIYKEGDEILGVCALHVVWEDLAEIKSLAVTPAAQLRGMLTSASAESFHSPITPNFLRALASRSWKKRSCPRRFGANASNVRSFRTATKLP